MAYRGTCDGLIYYYSPQLGRLLVRQYTRPKISAQNRRMGRIARQLSALELSAAYKNDLRLYVDIHNAHLEKHETVLMNWNNAFYKLMWKLAADSPGYIDLETLTRAQIEANDLPCRTVKRAVEAGLLPPVNGYELLTAVM